LTPSSPVVPDEKSGLARAAEQIQDAYLGHAKKQAAALVPAELVAGMSLIGTEGFVRDRIAAYRDAGVTILNVQPVGPNGLADVEKVVGWLNQRKCAG
jgi:alkanesulfonate monooxygenase SsuD/methylene tetrahydromethanopterin reductase-like flavin-dependent oxidoreductase (luciferase family)